jgi:hypothetical protein
MRDTVPLEDLARLDPNGELFYIFGPNFYILVHYPHVPPSDFALSIYSLITSKNRTTPYFVVSHSNLPIGHHWDVQLQPPCLMNEVNSFCVPQSSHMI